MDPKFTEIALVFFVRVCCYFRIFNWGDRSFVQFDDGIQRASLMNM